MFTTKRFVFFVVVLIVAALTYLSLYGYKFSIGGANYNIKGSNQMRFGIDIRGGVDAVFEPANVAKAPTDAEMESARTIIESRLDAKNILDRDVTIDKDNKRIIVRFPWKSDEKDFNPQKAIAELGETAKLTFRDPQGNIVIEGKHVTKSAAEFQNNSHVVSLELNAEGAAKFAEATGRLINQRISIYLDQTLISAPTVSTQINEGKAVITGMENAETAKDLSSKINAGALPFDLVSKNHSSISPTLGNGALDVMVKSGIFAFIFVCLFMIFYYRLPGLVACLALLMQTVCQLLALSIPQFTLTLPGIAGIILSIGMGVDANVIIAERIKEELRDGKTLAASIDAGFRKAFSAVFDGNITVIIVALILMKFGSGAMLSFGYSLLTGVILNFLTGVTASRLMIKSLSGFGFLKNRVLYGDKRRVTQ